MQIREEEYPDLPPDTIPPNDAELWERSVGGWHKSRIFLFEATQDPWYAMTGHSSASFSGSSHCEEEVCLANVE